MLLVLAVVLCVWMFMVFKFWRFVVICVGLLDRFICWLYCVGLLFAVYFDCLSFSCLLVYNSVVCVALHFTLRCEFWVLFVCFEWLFIVLVFVCTVSYCSGLVLVSLGFVCDLGVDRLRWFGLLVDGLF